MEADELLTQLSELYKKKNEDYGSSWTKTGEILEILFEGKEIKINSIKDYNVLALLIRILDKICRFTNIYFISKNMKINEKLVETASDTSVYWSMLACLVEKDDDNLSQG